MAAKPRKKSSAKQKDGDEGESRKRKRTRDKPLSTKKVKPGEPGYDPYDFTSSEEEGEEEEEEGDTPTVSHDQGKSRDSQVEDEDMDTDAGRVQISDQRYTRQYACVLSGEAASFHILNFVTLSALVSFPRP